ncbi:MAG: hypothetical protein JNK47_10805 [Mesorhizobium sp.]|nr:hypothetical protein [Mesorhizobium sp.]MBL8577707.1 hypothetical protein [Mesorhizobium sp.]
MAGNSNSGRRKSEKTFANMLRVAVHETGESGQPRLRELAEILVTKAIAGDVSAIKEIADRLDGKPMQQMAVVSNRPMIEMTDQELMAIASGQADETGNLH